MNAKFLTAIVVVVAVLGFLIYTAGTSTAKQVVTVAEVLDDRPVEAVQIGARVAPGSEIEYKAIPERTVRFSVVDISVPGKSLSVVYHGAMPDTLRAGRDVILQGKYDGEVFTASSLVTQCPSKYEPPVPKSGSGQPNV